MIAVGQAEHLARCEGHGKGSEFIARLPIGDSIGADQSVPKAPTQMSRGKKMHVLIVDDNEDTTETAALLVGAWDHKVRVAHTGAEALQVASDFEPEVILLDIGLPEIDGYEVARRLRQDPRFKDTR
jgi:PleD family two-component response regulator